MYNYTSEMSFLVAAAESKVGLPESGTGRQAGSLKGEDEAEYLD